MMGAICAVRSPLTRLRARGAGFVAALASIAPAQLKSAAIDWFALRGEVINFFRKALDTTAFQPRWQTENWSAHHTWLHIGAECVIALAYLLISAVLLNFCRKRRGFSFAALFWLLGLVLFAGGITHLLDAAMFWWPAYRLTGLVKAGAAILSLIAAALLVPLAPKAVALRSPLELEREIVQRRKTERELRQVHAQLEGVIEQRTAELASKNEEMEQFLNTVSHDLKSPVVTCLGLTGMLREDMQAGRIEESNDTINRIESSAKRMRQLIEDLLHLSKIGKVRFDLSDVDTDLMVRAIRDEYAPRLKEKGVVLQIESKLPTLRADVHWLTEVFENLIGNALKYGCDNPHPRIVVGAVTEEKEHRFYVRDNGRGIDPAHHAQILEPFRRLQTDKEGSGMGLAIVVRIIKMHGGRLWIESKPGQGATFWIALSAAASRPAAKAQSRQRVEENEQVLTGSLP